MSCGTSWEIAKKCLKVLQALSFKNLLPCAIPEFQSMILRAS
jgi:hypothetical protein